MKNYTKEQLTELVIEASKRVSEVYMGDVDPENPTEDTIAFLAKSIVQIQRNCENIIVEVLYEILNEN